MLTSLPAKPPSGTTHSGIQCFKLTYESLEGYGNILGRKLEQHAMHATYRLRGCLYNVSTREFIGRFYSTPDCRLVEVLQSGAVVCQVRQDTFFYAGHSDPHCVLVTEITGLYESTEVCVGWSMYPLFHHQQNQTSHMKAGTENSPKKAQSLTVRLAVYEGTPRLLFTLKHPTQDGSYLTSVPGCILSLGLSPHPSIARASHMIPPLLLVSPTDVIPGLVHSTSSEAFPKIMKSTHFTVDKMSLLLLPTVDEFEENLLSLLAEDLVYQGSGVDDTSPIVIEERRLKVMVYNGWRYVGSPCIVYLDKMSSAKVKSSSRNCLVLKGSLDLSNVVGHELLEVVFQLEYAVSWRTVHSLLSSSSHSPTSRRGAPTKPKPASVQNSTVVLCWAVYQPYASLTPEEIIASYNTSKQITLDLKAGHGFKPVVLPFSAHAACYQKNTGDAGKLTFRCESSRISSRLQGINTLLGIDTCDLGDASSYSGSIAKLSLAGDPAKQREQLADDQARLTSTPDTAIREVVAAQTHSSHHPVSTMIIKTHQADKTSPSWPLMKAVPRNILAYFHSSGIDEFKDDRGNSFPTRDPPALAVCQDTPPSHTTVRNFREDQISEPHRIAIQLLGYEQSSCFKSELSATRSLSNLYMEIQFYNFPEVALHVTAVSPPSNSKHLPHLLLDSPGDQIQSMIHYFQVGPPRVGSSSEQHQFSASLRHGHLNLTIFDGTSLLLLGVTNVPLVGLIPLDSAGEKEVGSPYSQHAVCCPVYLQDSCLSSDVTETFSSCPLQRPSGGSSCQVVGHLYLRLARLPPKPEGVALSAQYPDIARIKSITVKTASPVARRLYGSHTPWRAEVDNCDRKMEKDDDITRSRKYSRMQKVRQAQKKSNTVVSSLKMDPKYMNDSGLMSCPFAVEVQQDELKYERISGVLQEALTTQYVLRPTAGRVFYWEHTFTNTLSHPLSVSISWKHPDLRLVTNNKECQFLRRLHSVNDVYNHAEIVTGSDKEAEFGFLVHPGESVLIPFKYQTFHSGPPTRETAAGGGTSETEDPIKVFLLASQHDIVGVLDILVKPRPLKVDKVLHFVHPERTFFKKSVEVDTSHPLFLANTPAIVALDEADHREEVYACTSHSDILCETQRKQDQCRVFLKALVGAAPTVQKFHVFLYKSLCQTSPSEVWLVVIHAAFRIKHPLILGQASTVKLLVRGDHVHRKVSCYCSAAATMTVVLGSPFLLTAYSLMEVQLCVRTLSHQSQRALVSVVEVGGVAMSHLLIGLWVLEISTQEPIITKAFQIALPTGNASIERNITFTNPYPKVKVYQFSTDLPDIVTFKQTSSKLEPQETIPLSLLFHPCSSDSARDVFVFINDSDDQIEECFFIKITYSKT